MDKIKKIAKNILKLFSIIKFNLFFKENKFTYEEANKILENCHKDVKSSCISKENNKINIIKDKTVSIIIPTYNNEKYIEKSINSILNQKIDYDYELIVINDGSKDNTIEILKKYEFNENIIVINKTNEGVSAARNLAIAKAKGKYLIFMDADDIMLDNSINILLKNAIKYDADIVQGNYQKFNSKGKVKKMKKINFEKVIPLEKFNGYVWGKVYKSELFNNIVFPDKYWHQDSINAQIIYSYTNNCYTISDYVYGYFDNTNGISYSSKKSKKSLDSLYITRKLLEDREILKLKNNQEDYEYFLRNIFLIYWRTKKHNNKVKEAIFITFCYLKEKYYKEYKTKVKKFKRLEIALEEKNYRKYIIEVI